jgi:hypothetical protein
MQYHCGICGEKGHNARTCPFPDTRTPPPKTRGRVSLERQHPGLTSMLGVKTDSFVAQQYGLSRQRINQIRKGLGIDASQPPLNMTPQMESLLGTASDSVLAARWGVSTHTVCRLRTKLGIACWSRTDEIDRALEPYLDDIGRISDPKIARMAGVSAKAVFGYRRRHGIKTEVLSPAHPDFKPLDKGLIATLYREGYSDEEIAARVGSTKRSIATIRSRSRLVSRKGRPAKTAPRKESTRGEE